MHQYIQLRLLQQLCLVRLRKVRLHHLLIVLVLALPICLGTTRCALAHVSKSSCLAIEVGSCRTSPTHDAKIVRGCWLWGLVSKKACVLLGEVILQQIVLPLSMRPTFRNIQPRLRRSIVISPAPTPNRGLIIEAGSMPSLPILPVFVFVHQGILSAVPALSWKQRMEPSVLRGVESDLICAGSDVAALTDPGGLDGGRADSSEGLDLARGCGHVERGGQGVHLAV